jgi:RNA polymerase sigma factor (sigma-70 family)
LAGEAATRERRLEELFDTCAGPVRRYLLRRGAGDEADDLLAEVFVVAWRRLDAIPPEAELPWLYRTAWNVLANHRRLTRATAMEDADGLEPDFAGAIADRLLLLEAWRSLSDRDREILRLVAWEGVDGRGLAEALGIGVGGAGAALSRARAALATAWRAAEAGGKNRAPGDTRGMQARSEDPR